MASRTFRTPQELESLIERYFNYIEGECLPEENTVTDEKVPTAANKKQWARDPEPATIAGLTLFLGFNSRAEFNDYCLNGDFADILNRGNLRIEACYEKKLHNPSPAGAIFALKSMGRNEKDDNDTDESEGFKTLKVELIECGPKPAGNERDVLI
jgi:hypothetical protein